MRDQRNPDLRTIGAMQRHCDLVDHQLDRRLRNARKEMSAGRVAVAMSDNAMRVRSGLPLVIHDVAKK